MPQFGLKGIGRERGREPMCVMVRLNKGKKKGRGKSPCVPQFGSMRAGKGKGKELMCATVQLDKSRKM